MKNTLNDLNNHMFEQLERLNDEELTEKELNKEIKRSKAMGGIAQKIISNANTMLSAARLTTEHSRTEIPNVIGIETNDKQKI